MKRIRLAITAAIFSAIFAVNAYAGIWRYEPGTSRWWYDYGDRTYPVNEWVWLDGNGDAIYECYRFNEDGYLLMDGITPDGYYVNSSGEWIVDGIVQTRTNWYEYDPYSTREDGDFDYDWGNYYYLNER